MDFPIWAPALGGGVLIAIVAIAHVVVSHFAVGGGLALAVIETLGYRRQDRALRELARRGSLMLILISTVFGAISGVGIWFTIGLVSPAATSSLIHNYVWGWAIEWCFFILEVATALAYYATWGKVRPRTHLLLIWLYAGAAYMSLVVIQGILGFMLTPGRWLSTHGFWDGLLNPTYLPGLVLRTGVCLMLAGSYLTLAAFREKKGPDRWRLFPVVGLFQLVGVIVAYLGYRWWEAALPASVQSLFLGAKAQLPSLLLTRGVALAGLTLFLPLALIPFLRPRWHRWPVAVVALLAGFAFLGGYERLREGVRKPFVIRDYMFSNGVLVDEIGQLNREGILSKAQWAAPAEDASVEAQGRGVFRAECSSCHTQNRYLSIQRLITPPDPDRVNMVLTMMSEDGHAYEAAHAAGRAASTAEGLNYPFMPPFVGTEQEMEALARYLVGLGAPSMAASGAGAGSRVDE